MKCSCGCKMVLLNAFTVVRYQTRICEVRVWACQDHWNVPVTTVDHGEKKHMIVARPTLTVLPTDKHPALN